jgi:hypothetical protein
MTRPLLALGLLLASVTLGVPASAQDEPQPPPPRPPLLSPAPPAAQPAGAVDRSTQLGWTLEAFAAEARGRRAAEALGEAALGLGTIVPGAVLMGRNDPTLQLVGTSLVVVGAAQLLTVPALFISTPIEQLDGKYKDAIARGEDPGMVGRRTEAELFGLAERRRSSRVIYGATSLVLGLAAFGTGIVFLVQPAGILGLDQQSQYVWGSVLTGIGGAFVVGGLRGIFERTPEETAWAAYAGTSLPRGSTSSLRVVPVVGPTAHGLAGGLQLVF